MVFDFLSIQEYYYIVDILTIMNIFTARFSKNSRRMYENIVRTTYYPSQNQ